MAEKNKHLQHNIVDLSLIFHMIETDEAFMVNGHKHIKSANGLNAWAGTKDADGTTITVITKKNTTKKISSIQLVGISTFCPLGYFLACWY